jgi:hypothetical protein
MISCYVYNYILYTYALTIKMALILYVAPIDYRDLWLPNEIWTNIFMYMVKKDVAAIQLTCKNWHALICTNYVKNQIELNTPLPTVTNFVILGRYIEIMVGNVGIKYA